MSPPLFLSEALFMLDADLKTRIPITRELLAAAGLTVEATELSAEETSLYVELAQRVDDGEAQALAIAMLRRLPFLSDDDAGLKIAREQSIEAITTLDLAYKWSAGRDVSEVKEACRRLRFQARYAVPRLHPRAAWYLYHLEHALD